MSIRIRRDTISNATVGITCDRGFVVEGISPEHILAALVLPGIIQKDGADDCTVKELVSDAFLYARAILDHGK